MPVSVTCPHCHKVVSAPDALGGQRVACPGCHEPLDIPLRMVGEMGEGSGERKRGGGTVYGAAASEMLQDAKAGEFNPPGVQESDNKPVAGNVCPHCGQPVVVGSRICIACGRNVFATPVAAGGAVSDAVSDSMPFVKKRGTPAPALGLLGGVFVAFLIGIALFVGGGGGHLGAGGFWLGVAFLVGIVATVVLFRLGEGLWALLAMLITLGSMIALVVLIVLMVNGRGEDADSGTLEKLDPEARVAEMIRRDLEILAHPDADVESATARVEAADRLLKVTPVELRPKVAETLELYLDSPDARVRERAVAGVGWMVETQPRVVGTLLKYVNDPVPAVRAQAMASLAVKEDPRVLAALLARLPTDLVPASEGLKLQGPKARATLVAMLRGDERFNNQEGAEGGGGKRILAARALGIVGDPTTVAALKTAAKDADVEVALAAREAWRKIAPGDFDAITDAQTDLAIPAKRLKALQRLAAINPPEAQDPRRGEIVTTLIAQLTKTQSAYVDSYAQVIAVWQVDTTAADLAAALAAKPAPGMIQRHGLLVALAKLNDVKTIPLLIAHLTEDPVCGAALVEYGRAAEEPLLAVLTSKSAAVQGNNALLFQVCNILGRVGSMEKALPVLQGVSKTAKNPGVASAARLAGQAIVKRTEVPVGTP